MVLWPSGSYSSTLADDLGLIERYLTLCEATKDEQGIKQAMAKAVKCLSPREDRLPPKSLSTPNEVRATIAYQAYEKARNEERTADQHTLLTKAMKLDPSVALYQIKYARLLMKSGHELIREKGDIVGAVRLWKQGIGVVNKAKLASARTATDDDRIESLLYDLTNVIDMARAGFYDHAADQAIRQKVVRTK
jgi:hypothetical protein